MKILVAITIDAGTLKNTIYSNQLQICVRNLFFQLNMFDLYNKPFFWMTVALLIILMHFALNSLFNLFLPTYP